jgi:oligoendopeptidase F
MQAVIEEARRTSELEKQKQAFEEEKTRINNIHALRESVRLKDFNSIMKFYDDEIAQLKKNYVDYSDEVKAQDEAKSLLMSQNHSKLMDLLKSWNPDWMKRGKDFGQSLLDGINEKIPQINSAIETIMSKINSVYKASEAAVKAGTAKVGTIANVNTMVPNAITANIGESKTFNLYVDGKNMASTIAPHMTDVIKAKNNTIR